MLVAVTGGTGFVGSHTVAAILARGHRARLLVRSRDRIDPALSLHGLAPDDVEVAVADLTDDEAIGVGLDGCDAVVHAASVFSFDPARADEMSAVNLAGMRSVIDHAVASALDPIVHVSSYVALLQDGRLRHGVGPDEPVGDSPYPYSGSKAEQEREARRHQDRGHPVVIVHPGSVWGPKDPHMNESHRLARQAARGLLRAVPPGSLLISDVRDVAEVLAATLEPGKGARRYSAVGHPLTMADLVRATTRHAGREMRVVPVPDRAARGLERAVAVANRRGRAPLGFTAETVWLGRHSPIPDNARTEEELGVRFRPTDETVRDQVEWMRTAGRL